jgi:Family of unknown function (DUF6325)
MEAHEDELGPIDVVVIGYPPGAPMRGEAVPILLDLVNRGVVRVLDALVVRKDTDGSLTISDPADLDPAIAGDLTEFAGASTGLLSDDDAALVGAEMQPGSAAAMLVYENRWAAPFVAAVRRNGGVLIANERIHTQDLLDALDAAESAA